MTDLLKSLAAFIFVSVIFKYIVAKWIADQIRKVFIYFFVRTEREMAIWLHYQNRALNHGHQHQSPVICVDGKCKLI